MVHHTDYFSTQPTIFLRTTTTVYRSIFGRDYATYCREPSDASFSCRIFCRAKIDAQTFGTPAVRKGGNVGCAPRHHEQLPLSLVAWSPQITIDTCRVALFETGRCGCELFFAWEMVAPRAQKRTPVLNSRPLTFGSKKRKS